MKKMTTTSSSPVTPTGDDLQALAWTRPAHRPRTSEGGKPLRKWSRYERLSFSMLGYTWGLLIIAVTALHFGNYHLETRTSSTSGSHSGFYESAGAIRQKSTDEHNQPSTDTDREEP